MPVPPNEPIHHHYDDDQTAFDLAVDNDKDHEHRSQQLRNEFVVAPSDHFVHDAMGGGGEDEDDGDNSDVEIEVIDGAGKDEEGKTSAAARENNIDVIDADEGSDTPSLANIPRRLKPLAKQIRKLDATDLLTITEMTQRISSRELYSLLPYNGSSWYMPETRAVGCDEPHWDIHYDSCRGIELTVAGRLIQFHIGAWLLRGSILVLFWYMLYNALGPKLMTHGGYVWDPVVTFVVSAIFGGAICRLLQIPTLLGVLWVAIMWANIGPEVNYLTHGVYKDVSRLAQRTGLALVLARAGFSLSLKAIRPHWQASLMLAMLPYGVEATFHGLIAKQIFGFSSYTWSFLEGCICSSISPAVVVPGVLHLQDMGYGKGKGPLSLLLSAVGIEVCLGVWAVNFIIGLLFNNQPLTEAIVYGPVQIIVGALLGMIVGNGFHYFVEILKREAKRLPNGAYAPKHKKAVMNLAFVVFLLFCLAFVFFGYAHSIAGGGAVMTVFFSATVAHRWIKDDDKELVAQKMNFGQKLAKTWDLAVMIAQFSMVGVGVTLSDIFNSEFFPKALGIVCATSAVRACIVFLVQTGQPYDWKQKLLVSGAFVAKATSQASLGPIALATVTANIAANNGVTTPELAEQLQQAQIVSNMAIMYILV
ncbi:transmembrane protein, putative, partial [Bodo saltans]